ncbi:MAG: DUF4124 domain-containing protein [Gammaproteobacteria bacterium]|nr:DUF4124 domain-containing protein [Gammaproteobacteria bacterium]
MSTQYKHTFIPLLGCLLLLLLSPAQATIYKWVDNEGTTQYTQAPPIGRASTIVPRPVPSDISSEEARTSLLKAQQKLKEWSQQRKEKKLQQKIDIVKQEQLIQQCRQARIDLANLGNAARQRFRTAEGEYVRLSEEQRRRLRQQLRDKIEKNCSDL